MTLNWDAGVVEPTSSRPMRALKHRTFAVVWSASLVGNLGFWMASLSYQWLVADDTDGSAFALGLIYFFLTIPFLIFSPIGGFLADRFDRRRLFAAGQVAVAVVAITTGLMIVVDAAPVAIVFTSAFLLGSALSMNAPAQQAIVANLVPMRDLASAVSLQSIGINLARVAGPALTTPLLVLGAGTAFFVYGIASLFVGYTVLRVDVPELDTARVEAGILSGIRGGLRYVATRQPVGVLLTMVAVTAIFGSCFVSMLPVFGAEVLDAGRGGFTGLVTAMGIGAMAGALFVGYREQALHVRSIAVVMMVFGVVLTSFSILASAHLIVPALVLCGAGGFCSVAVMTALSTVIQRIVADDMRGRVMGLYILCLTGGIPIGSLALGAFAGSVGAPVALSVFASICAGCGVVVLLRSASYDRALRAAA